MQRTQEVDLPGRIPDSPPLPLSSLQVGTVEAIDRDAGENGRVSYTILSGNLNDTFDIDRSTGALFTSREVSRGTSARAEVSGRGYDEAAVMSTRSYVTVDISSISLLAIKAYMSFSKGLGGMNDTINVKIGI